MDCVNVWSVFIMISFISDVNSAIDFQCEQEQCLNEPVQYQCTVNGSSSTLQWTIKDETMDQLGTQLFGTGSSLQNFTPIANANEFSTDLSSTSPLISKISFTAQSSINGYTIQCEDTAPGGDVKNCTIDVADIIPPPAGFTLVTTKLVLYINWTQPSHQCVSNYTVRTNYSIIVTADEGVDIPLAGLPPTTYCASVAVADIANRTGKYSEEECIELGVPDKPILILQYYISSLEIFTVQIQWTFNGRVEPQLTAIYLSHNVTGNWTIHQLSTDDSEFGIDVEEGEYSFSVFGENILGNGSSATMLITVIAVADPSKILSYSQPLVTPHSIVDQLVKTLVKTLVTKSIVTIIEPTQSSAIISSRLNSISSSSSYAEETSQTICNSASTSSYSLLVLTVSNSLTLATTVIITAIVSSLVTVLVTKKCCSKSKRPRSFVQHDQPPLEASYAYITRSSMDFQTATNPAYTKPEKA